MIVTKAENVAYIDIDNTLIRKANTNDLFPKLLDYYGNNWNIIPKYDNIQFLKSLKSRGYYIIVHSANGWQHALNVVNLLELTEFVDEIKTKPQKYVDDEPVENWFGPRIYFEENGK